MTPDMHDTLRRWLSGLGPPSTPNARRAWLIVRLEQRASQVEYVGWMWQIKAVMLRMELRSRLATQDRDWLHVIATMLAGAKFRRDSIKQTVVRYKIHHRRGGRV